MAGPNAKADLARLMAVLRYRVRSRIEVQVLDLTEGGCMVESRGWSVNPQERVMVKLPGLAEMAANVVWIEDHRAGLAFEDPLYGPVVENLVLQM